MKEKHTYIQDIQKYNIQKYKIYKNTRYTSFRFKKLKQVPSEPTPILVLSSEKKDTV